LLPGADALLSNNCHIASEFACVPSQRQQNIVISSGQIQPEKSWTKFLPPAFIAAAAAGYFCM